MATLSLHVALERFLERTICDNDPEETTAGPGPRKLVLDKEFSDFGFKYHVRVYRNVEITPGQRFVATGARMVELEVTAPGWNQVSRYAIPLLHKLYGEDSVCIPAKKHGNDERFVVSIRSDSIPSAGFPNSGQVLANKLARIRSQVLGAPLSMCLGRIQEHTTLASQAESLCLSLPLGRDTGDETVCHVFANTEKVLVVFTVDFNDKTERALARLFLQQFVDAQKEVSQTPHCEFRRGQDPPRELAAVLEHSWSEKDISGYLSFAFFPSHVKSLERRERAVEQVVNFLVNLEKEVKSAKSHMHIRMRQQKDELMPALRSMEALKRAGGEPAKKNRKFGGAHNPSSVLSRVGNH